MSEEELAADTRVPDRYMDKQEAIRHLIHEAIRLMQKHEDPFAIHLLVHSADKMLIDLAKKRGEELRVDWELYIKPEYHKAFFKKIRATYNYLKHADTDFDEKLPVHNIMMLNASAIFLCLANYSKLFGGLTKHMLLFYIFMLNIWPQLLKPEAVGAPELLKATEMTQGMTPGEFFKLFDEKSHDLLPGFYREVTEDLKDTVDFYHLAFYELREGQTKSSRILRIPEY
jgi:hypothetical protein